MNVSFGKRNRFSSQHRPENSTILGRNGRAFFWEEFPEFSESIKEERRAISPCFKSFLFLYVLS